MHKIVVGLGFGDETKGATVDWLCANNNIKAVIRFNGGPQAAHNVVTPDGKHHTFAQFGSGTFLGVPTHIARTAMFNPFTLWPEREHLMVDCGLPDPLDLLTVAGDALLITPFQRELNRRVEDGRGDDRHGSTGQGIGECEKFARRWPYHAPRVSMMTNRRIILRYLDFQRDLYRAEGHEFPDIVSNEELADQYIQMSKLINIVEYTYIDKLLDSSDCVFEGAQGVLLDELYGFNPHTTFSKTTQANARTLLDGREAECYGVSRTYHTRHGHGPFPTENIDITYDMAPEPHNVHGHYMGGWRVGALDLSLLRYAVHVNGGIDKLVVSHMDYLDNFHRLVGDHYEYADCYDGYVHEDDTNPQLPWLPAGGTMGAPYDREQSHKYGPEMFKVTPQRLHDYINEGDVSDAFLCATGRRPDVYSYGPTREDRKLVTDLLAVS